MIKFLFWVSVLFFTNLYSINYYIDSVGGDDNNSGCSTTLAWKTVSKVVSEVSSFGPGDIIAFKRGGVWNGESLYTKYHASGTENDPIVYTAYGTGARPIINVSIPQNYTFIHESGNIWSAVIGTGARFFKNGVEMLRAPFFDYLGTCKTEYYTFLVNGGNNFKLLLYSAEDPNVNRYSWDSKRYAIGFPGADYINIKNLDFQGGAGASFKIENNIGWKISNCNIGKNAAYGILVKYSSDILIDNVILDANQILDRSELVGGSHIDNTGCEDGIFLGTGSQNITIRNSFFKNWAHACFGANTTNINNKIVNIKFYNNELTGPDQDYGGRIAYSGYIEDSEFYNNYIHDIAVANQLGGSRNHFHHNIIDGVKNSTLKTSQVGQGIWIMNYNIQVRDNIIENNIIANTESKGLEIYSINFKKPGEVSGNIIRNNIFYNCGTDENNIAIQFHEDEAGQAIYNNTFENNLIYNKNTDNTCLYMYRGTLTSVSGFNNLNSKIKNNISGNPLFVNINNHDYHLSASSPAIDAGIVPLSVFDYAGNKMNIGSDPDLGIYEFYSEPDEPITKN